MSQKLRAWQREAYDLYLNGEPKRDFAVTATPGAGKTTFALTVARKLLDDRVVNRVIVVAPTDHLRTQWAEAAKAFHLDLDPKLGNSQKVKPGSDGYVTTYAQVAAHALLHERRTEAPNRCLVVFDEIHHAGDGLSWGEAIREAFTPAIRRLALTGTPFRTSNLEKIPFIRYEEDEEGRLVSTADYTYGYGHALADRVVRPVMFASYSGETSWVNHAGDILSADLAQPESKKMEQAAWRAVLDPEGTWVRQVITAAAQRLSEQRASGMSDAGCLVLASDQEQARAYAKVVRKVTGETPVVVLSDDVNASKKIDGFNRGNQKFLVAVRMVSEGVDIRRLATLVWLTSYQTPLFFAQAVGRVVRARNPRETATVFLPAVRPLVALAATIEMERDHVLRPAPEGPAEGEFDEIVEPREPGEPSGEGVAKTLDSQARFDHVLVAGRAITAQPSASSSASGGLGESTVEEDDLFGIPGLLSDEQKALILAEQQLRSVASKPPPKPRAMTQSSSATANELRSEIAQLVKQWAFRQRITIPKAHVLVRNSVPGVRNAEASVELLEERRDWLLSRVL